MSVHIVAVIINSSVCYRKNLSYLFWRQFFERNVELSEEIVGLLEKRLVITVQRRRVRKTVIALLNAVINHFLNLRRNKYQSVDL